MSFKLLAIWLILAIVLQPLMVLVFPAQVYAAGSVSDSYADSSKIDGANSSNQLVASGQVQINTSNGNFFGDGSDGDVTISSSTNLSSSTDGDMVVKEYNSLTINSSRTLTVSNRNKGLFIYVKGNAVINGSLSMSARGASVNPTTAGVSSTGLRLPMIKSGQTSTLAAADFSGAGSAVISAVSNQPAISGNGKIYTVDRTGNSGGNGGDASADPNYSGYPGSTGGNKSGGGGGGAAGGGAAGTNVTRGAAGTCFSGGSGGGAQYHNAGYQNYSTSVGGAYGGAGGNGSLQGVYVGGSYAAGGGAGNNGGNDYDGVAGTANDGGNGTGGLLYLIVGGNLTIGSGATIQANGVVGGSNNYYGGAGGSSGGGAVTVLYAGSLSNSGTVQASGGAAAYGGSHGRPGGAGGAGMAVLEQVDAAVTSSTIQSTNLLSGASNVSPISSYVYNLSSKPAGSVAMIQFSQNGSSWYNSAGTLDGTDTLTTGVDNSIDLSSLSWSGSNFYYKTSFTANSGGQSPVMDDIQVNYLQAPTAPTIGGASALLTTSIRWNFTDNSGDETGYRVFDTGDTQQVQCATADISYCDEGSLTANTSYTRKVAGYNGDGNGPYSSTASKYTLTGDPTLSFGSPTTSTVVLNAGNTSNVAEGTSGIYFDCTSASCDTGINAWVQATTDTATGLSTNTQYTFQVKARNGDSTETSYSSTSDSYSAIEVPTLAIDAVTTTTADLSVSGVSNVGLGTSGVYFDCTSASCDTGINSWLQTTSDTATGLSPNVQYTFQAKGRNGDSTETSYSSTSDSYTLAAVPSAPGTGNPQTTTIDVTPDNGTNSASTEMVLYKETGASCDGSGGSYIAANGSDNGATPVWQTESSWGTVTVSGLSEFTQYSFCTKAKNADAIETAYSSAGTTTTSESDIPSISSVDTVAGDASATYYDNTNDSSTVVAFTSTDGAGGGVDNCKWHTSDVAYDSMSNSCGSASSCTVNLSGEGDKTIYIRCQDIYSNKMSSSQQVDYTIDATDPTNLSSSNSSASWTNSKPTVTVSTPADATAGMNEIRYVWDTDTLGADCSSGTITSAVANLTGTLTEGSHVLYMCASDNAGNVSTWNGAYKWDNSNPLINITTHALTAYRSANIPAKIQGTASDVVSAVASTAVSVYNGALYWSGAAFDSISQVWLGATGTDTWEYTFAPSSDAEYTLQSRSTDSAGNLTASSTTVFIYDTASPTVSVTETNTPNTAGAALSWTTNEATSTQVEYGTNTSYGTTTSESDTSPRVTSHSIALTSLQSCTNYHYRVKGSDEAGNTLTGDDQTFTSTGCTGSSTVETQVEETVTTASGGTVELEESGSTQVSLTIPPSFAGSDADFQMKKLDKETVILTTSTPDAAKEAIGDHVYQLDALTSPTERVSSFDQAITVTMNYTDAQVVGYDESTLVIYRWDGSAWYELDSCVVDTDANTVSCTTSEFSTFVLFGESNVAGVSNGIDNQACSGLAPSNKAPWIYAAIPVGPNSLQLYFTDADKPVKDYVLQFGTEPGNYIYGSPNIGTYGQRVYTVTNLEPGVDYYFRITAVNDCYLPGPWSNEIRGNTSARRGVFVSQSSYDSQGQVQGVTAEEQELETGEVDGEEKVMDDYQQVELDEQPQAQSESKRMDFSDVINGIKKTFNRFMEKIFRNNSNNEAAQVIRSSRLAYY